MGIYALVDCNNFYVSCERVFRPDLEKKPVVVLSNNDGCIVSRSDEVKVLGVKMGSPVFKCRDVLSLNQVQVFSSNYTLYADMSDRVRSVFGMFTNKIEVYSIDECFLYFEECREDLDVLGQSIRDSVLSWTGIPVSVGFGSTKTLAKLANYLAKKNVKGVFDMSVYNRDKLFKTIFVSEVWGVGRKMSSFLRRQGVYTVFDYVSLSESYVKHHLHVTGLRTQSELKGVSCIPLEEVIQKNKSIISSRSFGQVVSSKDQLSSALVFNISRAAEKLRHQQLLVNTMVLFIMTNRFKEDVYRPSVVLKLPVPVSATDILIESINPI